MTNSRRRFLQQASTLGVAGMAAGTGAMSLLPTGTANAQAATGYELLTTPMNTADPEKVEVMEFFWFGCPHCYALEPSLNKWAEDLPEHVNFVREAPALNSNWEPHSRLYYAARSLNIEEDVVDPVFNQIHRNKQRLRSPKRIGKFIESLDLGVDAEKFTSTMDSFSVHVGLRRAAKLAQLSGISAVPSIIVNGKYRTTVSMAGGHDQIIEVVNRLVELEHSA